MQTGSPPFADATRHAYLLVTMPAVSPRSHPRFLCGSKNYPACAHPGPAPMGSDAISCGNEVVGANWCDCADAVGLVRLSMAKAGPRRRLGRRRGWDN